MLHLDPKICAQMHVTVHVIKMILESAQMLCSTWHISDPEHKIYEPKYKIAHKNHPCTIWVRASVGNYKWLCDLAIELCKEYTYRYGKKHASQEMIYEMAKLTPPIPDIGFTSPAQAMPDIYKDNDAVIAYHQYYFFAKYRMHSWKGKLAGRDPPKWIVEMYELFEDSINK